MAWKIRRTTICKRGCRSSRHCSISSNNSSNSIRHRPNRNRTLILIAIFRARKGQLTKTTSGRFRVARASRPSKSTDNAYPNSPVHNLTAIALLASSLVSMSYVNQTLSWINKVINSANRSKCSVNNSHSNSRRSSNTSNQVSNKWWPQTASSLAFLKTQQLLAVSRKIWAT